MAAREALLLSIFALRKFVQVCIQGLVLGSVLKAFIPFMVHRENEQCPAAARPCFQQKWHPTSLTCFTRQ